MPRAPHLPLAVRRELVLDAALRVAVRDPDGLSVDAVAGEAGVAKTVLYRCFANRGDMVEALAEREGRRLSAGIEAALEEAGDVDDPAAAVHRVSAAYFAAVAAAPDSYRLLYRSRIPADAARRIGDVKAYAADRLAAAFAAWLKKPVDDPTVVAVAAMVVSMWEAAALLLLDEPGRWTPQRLTAVTSALVAGGIPAVGG